MTNIFIVRPFGVKQEVDFNKVDSELIQPALTRLGLTGSTTEAIIEQGNIREDMFGQLLLADLVIADVSIHNANVFYELGVRHALRDKKTFLIRCSKDEIPFDLKTDRYLRYNENDPAACIELLVNALKATLLSDKKDSPVFYMLPKLEAQDPERFLAIPSDFGEEVTVATAARQIGKLALLANEAQGFNWEIPAMRRLGTALFKVKDFEASAICWTNVRDRYPNDQEANDLLSTIFQRQADDLLDHDLSTGLEFLSKSEVAIDRLLTNIASISSYKLAEIYALKGRNLKTRWVVTWRKQPEADRKKFALQSTFLLDAYFEYNKAFNEDLNHYYSGINALGMLATIISLANEMPDVFTLEFNTDEEAAIALKKYHDRFSELSILVNASIEARRIRTNFENDTWLNITEADLACLINNRPARVAALYQKIIQETNDFNFDSSKRQLAMYGELGVKSDNVKAALAEFEKATQFEVQKQRHYLLFTGHMIDKGDRATPRFPAGIEQKVRTAIQKELIIQYNKYGDRLVGISGGACGGDIIFHELCTEMGIKTEMLLLLPRQQYVVESVQFAGPVWVDRFDELYTKIPKQVLAQTKELPKWLQYKKGYTVWERNNLWMLHSALVCGGLNLTMIALWDGKGGDGAGGTEHMVKEAKARGAKTIVIDINALREG